MCVYMKVTKDEFELPLAVADTPTELARITGDNLGTINSTLSRAKTGNNPKYKYKFRKYVKVEID